MKFTEKRHTYTVKNRVTDHFKLDEAFYPPRLKQPRHKHLYASFSFVSSGRFSESFGQKTFSRQAATVIFHPPHESHAVDFENGVHILSVAFSFEKLADIREQSLVLDAPSSCRTETSVWLGKRLIHELRQTDTASGLAVEGLILEMLAEASRSKNGSSEKNLPNWLKQAKDFLHDNFDQTVTLETVAQIADVHPAHLSRVFREKFGCTIGEYTRRLRVEFASQQLLQSEKSLSEIASASGFADQSHFNRIFKNLFKLTPYEYRKIYRGR